MNQELEKLLKHCTVKILSGSSGWGTGFFVAPGLVLTCAHVLKNAANHPVQVLYPEQGQGYLATLESEAEFDYIDVALLRLQEPVLKHPCVYLDESVQLNDLLCSYGYPDDFTAGSFATFQSEALTGGNSFIKFKAGQVRSGMSGSPLLNQRTGKICGMVKFTRDRSIDLGGGAIPVQVILAQFPQLRSLQQQFHQSDDRWRLGITAIQTQQSEGTGSEKPSAGQSQSTGNVLMSGNNNSFNAIQAEGNVTLNQTGTTVNLSDADPMSQINSGGTNYQTQTGENNTTFIGGVHYHHSLSSTESQAKPPQGVPFPKVRLPDNYVDRPDALNAVKQKLLAEDDRTLVVSAISGLGGLGKSVLATALVLDPEVQERKCLFSKRNVASPIAKPIFRIWSSLIGV